MKGLTFSLAALTLVLVAASPSWAHDNWHGYHHDHYYGRPVYYGGYAPLVVTQTPVYPYVTQYQTYPTYSPVVVPGYPVNVAPAPYYYYRGPAVGIGFRTRGLAVGVGF